MIYCFECNKHGEFDVDLKEPTQSFKCPKCGKLSNRKWLVHFEGHYSMEHWAKDDPHSKEKITDMVDDVPGYDEMVV